MKVHLQNEWIEIVAYWLRRGELADHCYRKAWQRRRYTDQTEGLTMKWELCYGVMEKKAFGVPADNVGASTDFDRAKQIADKGTYRWVCEMWKEGGIWHWGDEVFYRSFFWPGRRAYENYPKPREG